MNPPESMLGSGAAGAAQEPGPDRREYAGEACLHEIVAAQCERTPERVAVSFEGAGLTYRELLARARGLAHRLQRLGVGPETLVGFCAERSLEAGVGVLASLGTGGAWVPPNPAYPAAALAPLVPDAATPGLLAPPHPAG